MMDWAAVQARDPIYLNVGGGDNCHPKAGYENYVSVDIHPPDLAWTVKHDLRSPIPLADGSVTRIHSEDCLEHLTMPEIQALLAECHRLLKAGGRMRIGVPDYYNPKDLPYLKRGRDPRHPDHLTLTHYRLMREIVAASPFARSKFYQYWDGEYFVHEAVDYSLGMVRRTPDNDRRCRRVGAVKVALGVLRDLGFALSRGFRFSRQELMTRRGRPLYVTSVVVDLFKD